MRNEDKSFKERLIEALSLKRDKGYIDDKGYTPKEMADKIGVSLKKYNKMFDDEIEKLLGVDKIVHGNFIRNNKTVWGVIKIIKNNR